MCAQTFVHSHNDYHQDIPLYTSIVAGAKSIEIDVILHNDSILVAHDFRDIPNAKDISIQYFIPITLIKNVSKVSLSEVQLMIDIKNEPEKMLKALISRIEKIPDFQKMLLNGEIKPIIISGSKPESYTGWPDYIQFDHQRLSDLSTIPLEKVGMLSFSFKSISKWNGKGRLTHQDEKKLREIIQQVHSINKPVRFWATPDTKSAWFTLQSLGVDFINTDRPIDCVAHLKLINKNKISQKYLSIENSLPSYPPFKKKTKNMIMVIGDGAGLGHLATTYYVQSGDMHLVKSKSAGYLITSSADDLITDSAAGGTALSTGQRTNNRHIGVSPEGKAIRNLFEVLPNEYLKIILTTDEIAGATPAAFYAHVDERDNTEKIIEQLTHSKVDIIVGGGKKYEKFLDQYQSEKVSKIKNIKDYQPDKINILLSTEEELPYKFNDRGEFLTENLIEIFKLIERLDKPYFLVIENSHTDGAGHRNSVQDIVQETVDFDKSIGIALQYLQNNNNTTLLALADHETGGVTIPHGNLETLTLSFSTDDHTAMPVPIFSWGLNSDIFQGFYPNYEVFHKIMYIMNLKQ